MGVPIENLVPDAVGAFRRSDAELGLQVEKRYTGEAGCGFLEQGGQQCVHFDVLAWCESWIVEVLNSHQASQVAPQRDFRGLNPQDGIEGENGCVFDHNHLLAGIMEALNRCRQ